MKSRITLFLMVIILTNCVAIAASTNEVTKEFTDGHGLGYTVTFEPEKKFMSVNVYNPTNRVHEWGYLIVVDRTWHISDSFEISPNESINRSYVLSEGVDVVETNHTVEFQAGSDPLYFNFTEDIDPSTTERYPTPEITDVTLETEMVRGEERSVINVSGYNPSGRYYTTKITAHTFETTMRNFFIQFEPHGSGHGTIVLDEPAGELIVGEVRMYERSIDARTEAFDQVEIRGKTDGEVEWSREEYVTVEQFGDDRYVYENESMHRAKVEAPETYAESPVVWTIGGVIGLALLLKIRRWLR